MLHLKDLLSVCVPDWLQIGRRVFRAEDHTLTEEVLNLQVKNITGWDDGLTVELFEGSSPCECLPVRKGRKANEIRKPI